jgi:hypothetical protein
MQARTIRNRTLIFDLEASLGWRLHATGICAVWKVRYNKLGLLSAEKKIPRRLKHISRHAYEGGLGMRITKR